ncbi:MAG: hypothetical protein P4M09_01595 [Devosia sp.]|nr:hypothetical protein [Devosia sp.]
MLSHLLAIPAILLVTPALAASAPKLTNFAHLMAEAAVGENAPVLTDDFTRGAKLGSFPIAFEQTPLNIVRSAYGGTVQRSLATAGAVRWLCYTRHASSHAERPLTVWFMAVSADPAVPTLNMVVMQSVDAARADGCSPAPAGFAPPSFTVPGMQTRATTLKARFGALPFDRVKNLYYDSVRPLNDGSGKAVYQRLGYVISKGGVVVGLAVSQSTN